MSDRKRLLNDLRVIDLRAELERRNLDKSGVRGVLIQRLSKYLEDEGHDPATYMFDLSAAEVKSTPSKRTRRSESTVEADTDDTPTMEDMIVQDDAGDDDDAAEPVPAAADDEVAADSTPADTKMDVDDADKTSRKREIKDDTEATEPKKPCLDNDSKDDDHKGENNTDAEDSINLDLGEDELLNEETENTIKPKKEQQKRSILGARLKRLLQLLPNRKTDHDGADEDTAQSTGNETAADDAAGATNSTTSNDQHVNAEAPATSNDGDKGDEDNKDDSKDGEKRKDDTKEGGARNLWVSGLSGDTRAKDLKQLCSKYGKVIGAKVVTNARTPGSRCYGYVTMASAQDAENCIKNLHRTELHGRMISVEKAKSESESSSRRQASRPERHYSKDRKDASQENEDGKEGDKKDSKPKKDGEVSGAESHRSESNSRDKSHRSDKDKIKRSTRSRERRKSPRDVLSFAKIWKERDVERARERTRLHREMEREHERRRRAAEAELRERERHQRQEKHRLALEREKLRAEREKIEREKNELLRLERERHRLEREKLELERLELKRAQLRLEEERRKRGYESSVPYRKPGGASSPPEPAYERDRHKRPAAPPMSSSRGQFEAPPPPRFEMGAYDRGADKRDRDYKRDYPRHVSSGNIKYPSNGGTNDDSRQALPPGSRPKEPGRSYESRDSRSYRPSPPGKPEPRSWGASSRYTDAAHAAPTKGSGGAAGNETWSGAEPRYAGGGGGGGSYETRYPPAYQPPPPGAAYPDRYAAPTRDYRKY